MNCGLDSHCSSGHLFLLANLRMLRRGHPGLAAQFASALTLSPLSSHWPPSTSPLFLLADSSSCSTDFQLHTSPTQASKYLSSYPSSSSPASRSTRTIPLRPPCSFWLLHIQHLWSFSSQDSWIHRTIWYSSIGSLLAIFSRSNDLKATL